MNQSFFGFNYKLLNGLQPKTTRNTPVLEQVGLIFYYSLHTHYGGPSGILVRGLSSEKEPIIGFGFVQSDFGEDLRK